VHDAGQQLPGDPEDVRDHQQRALACGGGGPQASMMLHDGGNQATSGRRGSGSHRPCRTQCRPWPGCCRWTRPERAHRGAVTRGVPAEEQARYAASPTSFPGRCSHQSLHGLSEVAGRAHVDIGARGGPYRETASHHVVAAPKDGRGLTGECPRGNGHDEGQQLPGGLEDVRGHRQQALACGEGGPSADGQSRPGARCSPQSSRSAGLVRELGAVHEAHACRRRHIPRGA